MRSLSPFFECLFPCGPCLFPEGRAVLPGPAAYLQRIVFLWRVQAVFPLHAGEAAVLKRVLHLRVGISLDTVEKKLPCTTTRKNETLHLKGKAAEGAYPSYHKHCPNRLFAQNLICKNSTLTVVIYSQNK